MTTIINVEPLRSRRTGAIPILIAGTDFDTADLSNDFSGGSFYSDISIAGGNITQAGKLTLAVDNTAGSIAGIRTNHTFGEAFSVSISFNENSYAYPGINKSVIMGLRSVNALDSTTYFQLSLEYEDGLGYYLKTIASIAGIIQLENRKSINPNIVKELKIVRSQARMLSFIKIGSTEISIQDYYGFSIYDSAIEIFIENSPIDIAEDFSMDITNYKIEHTASLAHSPILINNITATEITGTTIASEPISGDIILFTPDGIATTYSESFSYTEAAGLDRDIKNFDVAISIYGYNVSPTRNELFTSGGGFTWDADYWVNPSKQNNNLYIPSLWDSTTSNIPEAYFQSGFSHDDAIEVKSIDRLKVNGNEKWHARLKHGSYYVKNIPYFLYSSESVSLQLGEEKTNDGRSMQHLQFSPKVGIPISASTLKVDKVSGLTIDARRFRKRGYFTGRTQNGIELNTSVISNIDKTKNEFIVKYNSNNERVNWKIPTDLGLSAKALITLGNITYTTKEYTSNFNGYSIAYIDDTTNGNEYIETQEKEIKIHIEDGISTSQNVTDAFNKVFATALKAEEIKIICLGGSTLDGKHFYLSSPLTDYYIWFNTGASMDPGVIDRTGIEVPISSSSSSWEVAGILQREIDKTADFKTVVNNEVVTLTNYIKGIVNNAKDIDTGLEIETIIEGSEDVLYATNNRPALSEISEIICLDGSLLGGKYFRLYSTSTSYYVWYNTGGSIDPTPDGGLSTGIEVIINTGDNGSVVATATRSAIIAEADFSASARSEVVTVITEDIGDTTNIIDSNTGMTFTTTQEGSSNTYEFLMEPRTLYTTYTFTLPEIPLPSYQVNFTRKDIFTNKKFVAEKYDVGIYHQFFYGEGIEKNNDYSINYLTGEITINLDQDYVDLGYVSYTFDYPATIEFNNNYLIDKGSSIFNPTINDIGDLDTIAISTGEEDQIYTLSEFPVLDYSTQTYLDQSNFRLFVYDSAENIFDNSWTRVRSIKDHGPMDKVYQLNSDKGVVRFGDGINGKIPLKYKKIIAGYKNSVRIEYEPSSSSPYWFGKNIDLNLSKNDLSSGFLFLSRKDLIPFQIKLQFSTNAITALEFADLTAIVTDVDGETIPGIQVDFELLNAGDTGLESSTSTTNFAGEASVSYLPSGSVNDLGSFVQLYEEGTDAETPGDTIEGKYFSSSVLLVNNMLVSDETVNDDPENIYIFKIYDDNDGFTSYNNKTRTGGTYEVLFHYNSMTGQNEVIKPNAISGKVLIFEESLPQPHNPSEPNYDPEIRGFVIIGKKSIQAKARVTVGRDFIDSDIANLQVEYSPIQKGEWTLPILPTTFTGSEINRATYIMLNPPKNEMIFTQSGDTDTITLEHNDVLGYTVKVTINNNEFGGWIFYELSDPNELRWDHNAIKDGDSVVITYAYSTP